MANSHFERVLWEDFGVLLKFSNNNILYYQQVFSDQLCPSTCVTKAKQGQMLF